MGAVTPLKLHRMDMRTPSLDSRVLALGIVVTSGVIACSSPNYSRGPEAPVAVDAGAADAGPADASPPSFAASCTATEAEIYGDPGDVAGGAPGDIIKCKDDGVLTAAQLKTTLDGLRNETILDEGTANQTTLIETYKGRAPVSGTHVYRVLYKTTRAGGAKGFAVATLYLPTTPIQEKLPLVMVARGSRGQAPKCAPSQHRDAPLVLEDNQDGNYVHDDYVALAYPLAGAGFAVVATDNAGYSPFDYGKAANLPSGYAMLDDVARSYLDSAYPLKTAIGAASNDKLVLVGLSQGGHTVLGAMQAANEHRKAGPIVAAAAYAPLWYTQRSWGITLNPLSVSVAGVLLNKSAGVPGSSWYHYTHAELQDGVGEGVKLFKPAVRDAVKRFVETTCWSKTYAGLRAALPQGAAGSSGDFFSDEMNAALGTANLIFGRSCADSQSPALCAKWLDRYKADHPVHTGAALDVPILLGYGLKDQSIPNARFACVVEKLKQGRSAAQFAKVEYCINPGAAHGGSVLAESDYVNDWIAAKAYGSPAPAANATACPTTTWDPATACDSLLAND